ncbi:hypothetical protein P5629_00180 (plasmid) [Bacillus subtilis]
MKKLIYSALATIIFIPSLSFFTDDSAKAAAPTPVVQSEEFNDSGTFTHNGHMYTYSISENDDMRKVTVSDDDEKSVAEYDKKTNKMYANGEQLDAEVQDFFKELANEEQININDDTLLTIQGYGDVPSGYKYKKGSTIKGSFAFVNASFSVVLAVIAASSIVKNFAWGSIVGIASAIISAITTPSFSVYWTRKTYTKTKGKNKRTGWQLRIYRDSKRKKLIHKEWASIGSGAIAP